MMRTATLLGILGLVLGAGCASRPASAAAQETTDPQEARADPDFLIQGEYLGEGPLFAGAKGKVGAQVVALGDGQFEAYILKGGLPGEGWKKGEPRVRIEGRRSDSGATLAGKEFEARISRGKMTLSSSKGEHQTELARVVRKSPTLQAKPPQGALVLFDGTNTDQLEGAVMAKDKNLMGGTTTKKKFQDYTLHLEFRLSYMPRARGQGRSNSGVYTHDCYEIQVLDSFGLEGLNNECGGIYSLHDPVVNMCLPPLVWQTCDVDFTAPRYDASGTKIKNARITLRHNGVVIHNDFELPRGTAGRAAEGPGPRPIHLQAHGNKVEYRNIWVLEKK